MRNFNTLSATTVIAMVIMSCSGCMEEPQTDSKPHFFKSTSINQNSNQVEYLPIHQLKLEARNLKTKIDETGFAPKLIGYVELVNQSKGPWPQAWIAVNVELTIKDRKLATITKAGVLQDHQLSINIDQELPKFGLKTKDIRLSVTPIAWMPTYPLSIDIGTQQAAEVDSKKAANVTASH